LAENVALPSDAYTVEIPLLSEHCKSILKESFVMDTMVSAGETRIIPGDVVSCKLSSTMVIFIDEDGKPNEE
jgi:hypothetical protein